MQANVFVRGAAPVRIALGYPNDSAIAVNNLGFRVVSQLLEGLPGVRLERFYLPGGRLPPPAAGILTEPSRLRLPATDLVLFSICFEGDALHLPAMLAAGGLPPMAAQRRDGHPLVVGGGAVVMINPEPLAAFFDLFLVGEAEALLADFLESWGAVRGQRRAEMIAALARLAGSVAPAQRRHRVWSGIAGGKLWAREEIRLTGAQREPDAPADRREGGGVATVKWEAAADAVTAARLPREARFRESLLLELARGCPHRCRFCVATRIYRPLRRRPLDLLLKQVQSSARPGETVGLLALSAGDYPQLEELTARLRKSGLRISLSSLPPDFARPQVAADLVGSGGATLTIAPETGSDRLRALIGKRVTNDRILETVRMLGAAGLRRLRAYFIIGLPFEEREDILAIPGLLREMRGSLPLSCALSATVNAFVPKPRTPFQWAPLAPLPRLRAAARLLAAQAPWGVRLRVKSFREAYQQAWLTRGDARWGERLARAAMENQSLAALIKAEGRQARDLHAEIAVSSPLPWDYLIDESERRSLRREWRRAREAARGGQPPRA